MPLRFISSLACVALFCASEARAQGGAGGDQGGLDDLLDMIDVVVTPAKKEQTIEQAPSITSVVKREQIEEAGYLTLAHALRQIPGMHVRDDLLHPNVALRGVDAGLRAWSRNLKVMVNGQPISYRSDTANWLGPEFIPLSAVSRVEVIRGPGSTLYGANAFLGVVNVITREGSEKEWGSLSIESGVLRTPCYEPNTRVLVDGEQVDLCERAESGLSPVARLEASVGHAFELGVDTRLEFNSSVAANYADRSGLMLPASSPHFSQTGARYFDGTVESVTSRGDQDLALSSYGQLSLLHTKLGKIRLEWVYSEFARHGEFTDWGVLTHENRLAQRNWHVLLEYQRRLHGLPISFRLRTALAGGAHTGRTHLQVARANSYWIRKRGGYLGVDASAEAYWDLTPKMTVIAGVNFTEDFHDLPSIFTVEPIEGGALELPSFVLGDVRFINVAGFAQWLYSPFDRLSLIGGLSYEQHNVYGKCTLSSCPGLNARAGASLSIWRSSILSLYVKLLYGSSFKAPPAELLYGTPYVVAGISGNPDLEPETAHTFESAIGNGWLLLGRRVRVDLLLNGFFNLLQGKVEYIQERNFTKAANSSDLHSAGVEWSLRASYQQRADAYVNFSWQRTVVRRCLLDDAQLCRRLSEVNPLYPDLLLSFGATLRHAPWRLALSLFGTFVGERWASQSNRTENLPAAGGAGFDRKLYELPSYLLLDLALSTFNLRLWGERETRFRVGLYNLLNVGPIEPGFNGIDTPGLGLTALLSARQQF